MNLNQSIKIYKDDTGARRIVAREGETVIIDCYLAPGVTFGNDGLIQRWGANVSIEHQREYVPNVRTITEAYIQPIEVDNPDVRCHLPNCRHCIEKPTV